MTAPTFQEIYQTLALSGFRCSMVSIEHLPKLQAELEQLVGQELWHSAFYEEIRSRYGLNRPFEAPKDFPGAQSVLITAAPQPKVRIRFELSDRVFSAVLPPTYAHDTDQKIMELLSDLLKPSGHRAVFAVLPEKLLAVHSGLAAFGRNNVSYIDGLGSYVRLKTFFTDVPCDPTGFSELRMMKRCGHCVACIEKCPTRAIGKERFLIDASKCLTYFNEKKDKFPGWIEPAFHNCLLGCMHCQDVCPENKKTKSWIIDQGCFTEQETQCILDGVAKDKLPPAMLEKLSGLTLLEDYELLQRNLGLLILNR